MKQILNEDVFNLKLLLWLKYKAFIYNTDFFSENAEICTLFTSKNSSKFFFFFFY